MKLPFVARKCPCGDPNCDLWILGETAELRLPKEDAKAVASLLNRRQEEGKKS